MYYIVYFKKVLLYKPKDNLNDILQFFNLFKWNIDRNAKQPKDIKIAEQ